MPSRSSAPAPSSTQHQQDQQNYCRYQKQKHQYTAFLIVDLITRSLVIAGSISIIALAASVQRSCGLAFVKAYILASILLFLSVCIFVRNVLQMSAPRLWLFPHRAKHQASAPDTETGTSISPLHPPRHSVLPPPPPYQPPTGADPASSSGSSRIACFNSSHSGNASRWGGMGGWFKTGEDIRPVWANSYNSHSPCQTVLRFVCTLQHQKADAKNNWNDNE
ncbi:hypothetical protein CFIMG_008031RA00001 [Ceratocystis fimbriata CBS 114723]|uniref:Uncharacterized protein n=1 Tax=Ceratocystis fimbriata CBS 114723 TaxID=1035309 RepID=A0A2C5XA48_9PEZI|nr:hypothetical protein CFIMG_008031RA00001 [Ceratocystis fimbriata CBS 114723]